MTSDGNIQNQIASRYGFARIGLSSPDGGWTFGNDGIVNDQKPMPCSENDSKDVAYVNKVFEFIDANPTKFKVDKIYSEGFSQNSMFAAYIGFCHSDRVAGVWQGGSGLALSSQKNLTLPGMQALCAKSVLKEYGKKDCMKLGEKACPGCKYWPIYPCYQPKRPMIECVFDYLQDGISSWRGNPENVSTTVNMYNALVSEGHDARMMRFSLPDPTSIKGHRKLNDITYWQVACWGITASCTTECENSFVECAKKSGFKTCISASKNLKGCTKDCSPTFKMMSQSEAPVVKKFSKGKFGANDDVTSHARPKTSICEA